MQLFFVLSFLVVGMLVVVQVFNNVMIGKLGDVWLVRNNFVIGEVWIVEFDLEIVKGIFKVVVVQIGINYIIDIIGLLEENGFYSMFVVFE